MFRYNGQKALSLLRIVHRFVEKGFDKPFNSGQGRFDFMGHIGYKITPNVFKASQMGHIMQDYQRSDLLLARTPQRRAVDRVDAGVLAENPFLAVDWMYQVHTTEGPQLGLVKHRAASKEGRGRYCMHNEVGYGETFRRTVTSLLQTLEIDGIVGPPDGAKPRPVLRRYEVD